MLHLFSNTNTKPVPFRNMAGTHTLTRQLAPPDQQEEQQRESHSRPVSSVTTLVASEYVTGQLAPLDRPDEQQREHDSRPASTVTTGTAPEYATVKLLESYWPRPFHKSRFKIWTTRRHVLLITAVALATISLIVNLSATIIFSRRFTHQFVQGSDPALYLRRLRFRSQTRVRNSRPHQRSFDNLARSIQHVHAASLGSNEDTD